MRVRAVISPMPGTEVSRSSAARQAGEPRTASSISRSSAASWASKVLSVALRVRWTRWLRGLAQPVGLHADHLDHLAAAGDQLGERLAVGIGERAGFGTDALGEERDGVGIQRIGLGEPPGRAGEVTDLARIDHGQRQACAGERGGDGEFEAAGGFQHDERRCARPQLGDKPLQAFAVARNGEGLPRRAHMDVEAILRNIDADKAW